MIECQHCFDTGYVVGTYTLCSCIGGDLRILGSLPTTGAPNAG